MDELTEKKEFHKTLELGIPLEEIIALKDFAFFKCYFGDRNPEYFINPEDPKSFFLNEKGLRHYQNLVKQKEAESQLYNNICLPSARMFLERYESIFQ